MLNIEKEEVDIDQIRNENRTIRHEIFDLQDEVKMLEDKLEEYKEDSTWIGKVKRILTSH